MENAKRVCIVTPDLIGPVRNGGIGTACSFLGKELSRQGYDVNILFTQQNSHASLTDDWMHAYKKDNIEVQILHQAHAILQTKDFKFFPDSPFLKTSLQVFNWLKSRKDFDIIFFMEWQGNGFYTLHAKETGLYFQNTKLVVQMHSPSMWHAIHNLQMPQDIHETLVYFIERKSVELADALISPSQYMIDWASQHGFKLPRKKIVLPNLSEPSESRDSTHHIAIDELVFFGRLEFRKGLDVFCNAVDILVASGRKLPKITFLGKLSTIDGKNSAEYIASRSKAWGIEVKILPKFDQQQALLYLKGQARLAIMPSVADNSPYTVLECVSEGIPFIASDVGGVSELITKETSTDVLFKNTPRCLADKIAEVTLTGVGVPEISFSLNELRTRWSSEISSLLSGGTKTPHYDGLRLKPFISVCLTHYRRPDLLKQAIDSLLNQDYPHFEVILVDDGSDDPISLSLLEDFQNLFNEKGWTIIKSANQYLGAARNKAVAVAKGEYVVFMDDDNFALPDMISKFAKAIISSSSDIVVSSFSVFSGLLKPDDNTEVMERFLPVGGCVGYSIHTNVIGDANSIVNKSFFNAVGGFTTDYGVGHEDFELFLKISLRGGKVGIIPDVLFWYRRNNRSMLSETNVVANKIRSFRPFLQGHSVGLADTALIAYVMDFKLHHSSVKDKYVEDPDSFIGIVDAVKKTCGINLNIANQLLDLARCESGGNAFNAAVYNVAEIFTQVFNATASQNYPLAKTSCAAYLDSCRSDIERSEFLILLVGFLLERNAEYSEIEYYIGLLTSISDLHGDASSYLYAAKVLLKLRLLEGSVEALVAALKISDRNYLDRRPDVHAAINARIFFSGIHHYALHGKSECTVWHLEEDFLSYFDSVLSENLRLSIKHLPESDKESMLWAIKAFVENR